MKPPRSLNPEFVDIAREVFEISKKVPDINWTEPRTGCAARAQLIGLHLRELFKVDAARIKVRRAWGLTKEAFKHFVPVSEQFPAHLLDDKGHPLPCMLSQELPKEKQPRMKWAFHVAVQIDFPDGTQAVIDPGLFSGPATQERWSRCFIGKDKIVVKSTDWDEPPRHGNQGSSYFPFIPLLSEGQVHDPQRLAESHMMKLNEKVPHLISHIKHRGDYKIGSELR